LSSILASSQWYKGLSFISDCSQQCSYFLGEEKRVDLQDLTSSAVTLATVCQFLVASCGEK
jgi:hypothetical protein